MGLSATLNGRIATSARVQLPAWGCWFADASVDGEVAMTGAAELKIADLTLKGTILSGGPTTGRSHFRIVGGAGGWGKPIKKESYTNDAGVKLSTVLTDAAREAGETLDAATLPADRLGAHWARKGGKPASRSLELLSPSAWYVGEDGITRLGKRAPRTLPVGVTHGPVDRARGMVTLASDSIASILPGVTVDGFEAVDVEHKISAETGLRSTAWGPRGTGDSRMLAAYRRIFEQLFPQLAYLGTWEYRVVTQEGKRLNLQPARVATGMPDLRRVRVRPGQAGSDSTFKPGALVLVQFIDAQASRPCVVGLEDSEGGGFMPLITSIDAETLVRIGAGALPVARGTDLAGPFPIVPTQVKVLA